MDKTVKVHEHLEYEIIEQKKTSTIVKDLNTNRSYACFKIDSPIGNKLTLFINKIKENGFPDFQHSILKSYIIGEIYEFDIVEEQEQGFILEDSIKTHICPFKWAVNPGQKKIKLRVRLLNKEKNQLIFELPNQNEELSMKDFLDDFMEKINILRETGNNSYHFPIIDESFVNKHPFLDIINKKYEILNFLNNSSQESILELSHLLITNVEDYEFIKLVLTYNLLDTIKLEEHNSHKILELIYKNLEKFYLKKISQNNQPNQIDTIIAYLYFLENGSYCIYDERQTFSNKYEIFIHKEDRKGYLLQCYDNGCINKVEIRTILEKTFGKIYQHGFNINATFLNYFVIKNESLIVAKSRRDNEEYIKVYSSNELTTHEAIHSIGINILQKVFDELIGYFVISMDYSQDLDRIIYKSRQNLGANVNNKSYQNEIKILNKIL